ncbi:hypothetical protein WMF04_18680 [Sorangium sp. So ce260]|uniref:hypothetical protein n=1 Tax=Sorangium sp. So ce260 TaxID=3133291 RepID=UPI003F60CE47
MCWTAVGPAGIPVSWDAEMTQLVPNEVVAWRSLPGEAIENEGIVRFEECPEGTRLDIKMSYSPPAGAIGHAARRTGRSTAGRADTREQSARRYERASR